MNMIEKLNLLSNHEKALNRYYTIELNDFQKAPFERIWNGTNYVDLDCERAVGKTTLGWVLGGTFALLGQTSLMVFPRKTLCDYNYFLSILHDDVKEKYLESVTDKVIRFNTGGRILLTTSEYAQENLMGIRGHFQYFDEFTIWPDKAQNAIDNNSILRCEKTLIFGSR